MRVGMAASGRHDARVEADKDADQVGLEDIGERGEVGVFGWVSIFGCQSLSLRRSWRTAR